MTDLELLKADLNKLDDTQDEYLLHLLNAANAAVRREGVTLSEPMDVEQQQVVVMYAAYLFRRRAGTETGMPRMLRYALNNLLFHQKAEVIV